MRIRVPDYYERFRCLAGACPHSCCEKWEVVIDEASVCLYRQLSGALGEKLRSAMKEDEEGDICFPLNGGRCPFLDDENLCEIHRQLGEQATSITCQEHPRFTEDYGPFREVTLSASCPAANALLLGSEDPLGFTEIETDEPAEEGDPWLEGLLPLRARMLELLTDRTVPLYRRLEQFLLLAAEVKGMQNFSFLSASLSNMRSRAVLSVSDSMLSSSSMTLAPTDITKEGDVKSSPFLPYKRTSQATSPNAVVVWAVKVYRILVFSMISQSLVKVVPSPFLPYSTAWHPSLI